MTCGECPVFKAVPPERKRDGIQGDGWCNINLPHDVQRAQWGRAKEAIMKTRSACSIGPLLTMALVVSPDLHERDKEEK